MKQLTFPADATAQERSCLLKAVMLSPKDETLRKKFFAHFSALDIAANARLSEGLVEISGWMFAELADPHPGQNLARRIEIAEIQGRAAGELLFLYYSFYRIASRTKSEFQKEDSFSSLKKEIAAHLGKSEAWLEKSWGDFKPVAHLWAAAFVESRLIPNHEDVFQGANARRFLASAILIGRFAVSYVPARQRAPLLDPAKTVSIQGSVTEVDLLSAAQILESLLRP